MAKPAKLANGTILCVTRCAGRVTCGIKQTGGPFDLRWSEKTMAIYEISKSGLVPLKDTAFSQEGVLERRDLQQALREQIDVIAPETMVLAEEFGDFEDSRRRIDLLGLDKQANLVVIELKRTETGGHMELQAIRYAAMVSTMTFDQAVATHKQYLKNRGMDESNAQERILDFLDWDNPADGDFGATVRIVLASAEFSREITSAVLWLNEYGLDIRCLRLRPYRLDDRLLLDVQQIIPLPEAAEYQVSVREKIEHRREAQQSTRDTTRYDLTIGTAEYRRIPKNELAYRVASEAITRGVTPVHLADLIPKKRNRLWVCVDGEVGQQEFIERATISLKEMNRTFDSGRYFTGEDRLIPHAGKTYALTNQWTGSALEFADAIIKDIGASDIRYGIAV